MDRGKSTHKLTYRVDPADAERRISEIDTIDRATAKEMIYPSNAGCERDLMPFGVHIPHLSPYTMKTKEIKYNGMEWKQTNTANDCSDCTHCGTRIRNVQNLKDSSIIPSIGRCPLVLNQKGYKDTEAASYLGVDFTKSTSNL